MRRPREDGPHAGAAASILHVDMDAFYASVEERERPELRGLPIIVGGTPQGRGVVAAASYAARRFGVRSAMPAATALRLCPQAVVVRSRMDLYARESRRIRDVLARFTPIIEPLALDEAFLDLAGGERLFGPPVAVARRIKDAIRAETGLVASVGVAPNKFLAKLASDADKPDGLCVIEPDAVQAFLDPLPVGRLWGVGAAAQRRFHASGVHTVRDLRERSPEWLAARFGRFGARLHDLAHGRDDRAVVPDHAARSISHETTFEHDVDDAEVLLAWLLELTGQVARRLRAAGLCAGLVRVKVRFDDFATVTRSATLARPAAATDELWRAARELLAERVPLDRGPVRLLGMGVAGLEPDAIEQGSLFDAERDARARRIDDVSDAIEGRFGRGSVRRGRAVAVRGRGGGDE